MRVRLFNVRRNLGLHTFIMAITPAKTIFSMLMSMADQCEWLVATNTEQDVLESLFSVHTLTSLPQNSSASGSGSACGGGAACSNATSTKGPPMVAAMLRTIEARPPSLGVTVEEDAAALRSAVRLGFDPVAVQAIQVGHGWATRGSLAKLAHAATRSNWACYFANDARNHAARCGGASSQEALGDNATGTAMLACLKDHFIQKGPTVARCGCEARRWNSRFQVTSPSLASESVPQMVQGLGSLSRLSQAASDSGAAFLVSQESA